MRPASRVLPQPRASARPSGDRATHSAASSGVAKMPRCTFSPPRNTFAWLGRFGRPGSASGPLRWLMPTRRSRALVGARRSVSLFACACCRTSWVVSGTGAAAAHCAAVCPFGDRATHRASAASSAVAKVPRYTLVQPFHTRDSQRLGWPRLTKCTPTSPLVSVEHRTREECVDCRLVAVWRCSVDLLQC
eukprot:scaffold4849_cov58-Phaeocystis_antarctica.AAC.2